MRAPEARLYVTRESAEGAIVCDTPQPARQGRYILLVYIYIYISRLTIVSRKAKKKQAVRDE